MRNPERNKPVDLQHLTISQLLSIWIARSGRGKGDVASLANMSYDEFQSRYFRDRDRPYTEPEAAIAVVRVFVDNPSTQRRATAAEAIRFLDLVQLPLSRYVEVSHFFPTDEWRAAWWAFTRTTSAGENLSSVSLEEMQLPVTHQLRAPVSDFVGRTSERERLIDRLSQAQDGTRSAIALISGLAGVGKSELATQVAHELRGVFSDAQIRLSFNGSSDMPVQPETALRMVIHTLAPHIQLSGDRAGTLEYLRNLYCSLLAGRHVLVLADDVAEYRQIEPLLPPVGSALLVTSRLRFTLSGALNMNLEALTPEEGTDLYTQICERPQAAHAVLAALCGYLPLAIRISASTLRSDATLCCARYLDRLANERDRLMSLCDLHDKTYSVEAALRVCYDSLNRVEQVVLNQLSVLTAPFDLAAAEAIVVSDVPDSTEKLLSRLYLRSLLDWDTSTKRYRLHSLVRIFAGMRLGDEVESVQSRHAQYFLKVARQANQLYQTGAPAAPMGLALFDREHEHLKATWLWAHTTSGSLEKDTLVLNMSLAMISIAELRLNPRSERIPHLEQAIETAIRRRDSQKQGLLLGALGRAWLTLGEVDRADMYFTDQLVLARSEEYVEQAAAAGVGLGQTAYFKSDFQQAHVQYTEALTLARTCANLRLEGEALTGLGKVYHVLGLLDDAEAHFGRRRKLAQQQHDLRGESQALGGEGNIWLDRGQIEQAKHCHRRQYKFATEIGDRHETADALGGLGYTWLAMDQLEQARDCFEQQLAIASELGDSRERADALAGIGHVHLRYGRFQEALQAYEEQISINQHTRNRREEGLGYGGCGDVYAATNDVDQAIDYYQRWHDLALKIGHRKGAALAAWKLGQIFCQQGQNEHGLRLMQERVAYEEAIGHSQTAIIAAEVGCGQGAAIGSSKKGLICE